MMSILHPSRFTGKFQVGVSDAMLAEVEGLKDDVEREGVGFFRSSNEPLDEHAAMGERNARARRPAAILGHCEKR